MISKFLTVMMVLVTLAVVGVFAWQFAGLLYEGHGTMTAQTATAGGAMAIMAAIICVDCGRQKYFRSPNRVKEIFASCGHQIGDCDAFGRTTSVKRSKSERREAKRLAKSRRVLA